MSNFSDLGQGWSRWHNASRALMAPGGWWVINQPQADRFLTLALELVRPSIQVQTFAYGTGGAGAHRAPEDVTTVSERNLSGAN